MVQPLKDEIAALQTESDRATEQMRTIEAQIDDLQKSIARLSLRRWLSIPVIRCCRHDWVLAPLPPTLFGCASAGGHKCAGRDIAAALGRGVYPSVCIRAIFAQC